MMSFATQVKNALLKDISVMDEHQEELLKRQKRLRKICNKEREIFEL